MKEYIDHNALPLFCPEKPLQSVYIDFIRSHGRDVLYLGEFEALRRFLLSGPDCIRIPITGESSHRITREFFKQLRKEQKKP